MQRTSSTPLGLALLLGALLLAPALPSQDPAPDQAPVADALPPGVAATIDAEVITVDEYKDHLLQVHGRRLLQEMVLQRLFRREAERLGVSPSAEELDAAEVEMWETFFVLRHGRDLESMTAELSQQGTTAADFRANFRLSKERELLQRNLVRARRSPSEEDLRARFDVEYGVGGERVEVRHLLLNRARVQAEMARNGTPADALTPDAVEAELVRRAEALKARIEAGASFEEVARRESHDLSVQQNGGLIPGYNYSRYGEPLAEVVRAAAVGEPSGPASTMAGVHLVLVESRERTDFEEVREAVLQSALEATPTWDELRQLEVDLRQAAVVRTF